MRAPRVMRGVSHCASLLAPPRGPVPVRRAASASSPHPLSEDKQPTVPLPPLTAILSPFGTDRKAGAFHRVLQSFLVGYIIWHISKYDPTGLTSQRASACPSASHALSVPSAMGLRSHRPFLNLTLLPSRLPTSCVSFRACPRFVQSGSWTSERSRHPTAPSPRRQRSQVRRDPIRFSANRPLAACPFAAFCCPLPTLSPFSPRPLASRLALSPLSSPSHLPATAPRIAPQRSAAPTPLPRTASPDMKITWRSNTPQQISKVKWPPRT